MGTGLQVGEPAPPLRLAEILQAPEGADATWEKLRGKVVVLDFWATGAARAWHPCRIGMN